MADCLYAPVCFGSFFFVNVTNFCCCFFSVVSISILTSSYLLRLSCRRTSSFIAYFISIKRLYGVKMLKAFVLRCVWNGNICRYIHLSNFT